MKSYFKFSNFFNEKNILNVLLKNYEEVTINQDKFIIKLKIIRHEILTFEKNITLILKKLVMNASYFP
jgi:hypothetical protein